MEPKEKKHSKVDAYGHDWPYTAEDEAEMKQGWSGVAFFLTPTLLSSLSLANDTSGCLELRTGIPTIKSFTIYSFPFLPSPKIRFGWFDGYSSELDTPMVLLRGYYTDMLPPVDCQLLGSKTYICEGLPRLSRQNLSFLLHKYKIKRRLLWEQWNSLECSLTLLCPLWLLNGERMELHDCISSKHWCLLGTKEPSHWVVIFYVRFCQN